LRRVGTPVLGVASFPGPGWLADGRFFHDGQAFQLEGLHHGGIADPPLGAALVTQYQPRAFERRPQAHGKGLVEDLGLAEFWIKLRFARWNLRLTGGNEIAAVQPDLKLITIEVIAGRNGPLHPRATARQAHHLDREGLIRPQEGTFGRLQAQQLPQSTPGFGKAGGSRYPEREEKNQKKQPGFRPPER